MATVGAVVYALPVVLNAIDVGSILSSTIPMVAIATLDVGAVIVTDGGSA